MTRETLVICPWCNYIADRVSALVTAEERKTLREEPRQHDGAASLCLACGEPSIFDSNVFGGERFPTFEEYATIMDLPEAMAFRQGWKKVTMPRRPILNRPEWST